MAASTGLFLAIIYNQSQLAERKHMARYWSTDTAATAVLWSPHPSAITKLAAAILGGGLFGGSVLPAQYCPCDSKRQRSSIIKHVIASSTPHWCWPTSSHPIFLTEAHKRIRNERRKKKEPSIRNNNADTTYKRQATLPRPFVQSPALLRGVISDLLTRRLCWCRQLAVRHWVTAHFRRLQHEPGIRCLVMSGTCLPCSPSAANSRLYCLGCRTLSTDSFSTVSWHWHCKVVLQQ